MCCFFIKVCRQIVFLKTENQLINNSLICSFGMSAIISFKWADVSNCIASCLPIPRDVR